MVSSSSVPGAGSVDDAGTVAAAEGSALSTTGSAGSPETP